MLFDLFFLSCLLSSTCLIFQPSTTCNSAIKAEIPCQDYIKINFSSQQELIKTKLKEQGITGALLKNCTDTKERNELVKRIIDYINAIYGQQGYINSSVRDYRLTESGKLEIDCSESAIPKSNFRFYIKDPNGKNVDIKNVISSSSSSLPLGNFTQIESEYLAKKLFRGQDFVRIDPVIFTCIKNTRLYKDLEYVIYKGDDGNVYCDVFCQGFGHTKSAFPGLAFSQTREIIFSIIYRDANFIDTKSIFSASGKVNLQKFLKLDHEVQIQLISDVVDSALWDYESADCSLFTLDTNCHLAKIGDTSLSIALMKRLRGLEYVTSGRVDPKTFSISAQVSKRYALGKFTTLGSFGHKYAGPVKGNTFRIEQKAAINVAKRHRINAKYIATNKLSYGDFRGDVNGKDEGKLVKIIATHEFLMKLSEKKISPFAGIFCDVLLEKGLGTNISAGIKVSFLNLTLSLPLLYLLPKGFEFPQLSNISKHIFPISEK